MRDGDKNRYAGKGVRQAVLHINQEINQALQGYSVEDQAALDQCLVDLDGSEDKSRLGANAILAVSLASARAYAKSIEKPLFLALNQGIPMTMPVPMMNVLNGGMHADNTVDFQEFMIMPVGASDFPSALQMGVEIFHQLKAVLKKQGLNTAVGDEGGFAPDLRSNRQALDILVQAIELSGFTLGDEIVFALDVAASELFQEGQYYIAGEQRHLSSEGLIAYYDELVRNYPIVSIEDGLDEQDWAGWQLLTAELGQRIQLVGDDLFVTNPQILQEGIRQQIANAILIKLNKTGDYNGKSQWLSLYYVASLRRNRGHVYCGFGGGYELRSN